MAEGALVHAHAADPARRAANAVDAPISIYELHAMSWRLAADGSWLDWDALAAALLLLSFGVLAQEAVIRKTLAERLPNLPKIDEVTRTPIPGLYEVRINGTDIVYTDAEGNEVKLAGANGVTVDREGGIYVSRADAGEILHFTPNGKLKRIIGRPDIKGFENVAYKPIKLAVDDAMRIYVVAQGMYEGIVELNPDGSFSRFFGVNKVTFSFAQYIWRIFATREQLQRQQLWLPTDFTNIAIDDRGFIYATIQDEKGQIIKRLNAKGENILRVVDAPDPNGDLWFNESGVGIPVGPSVFIAVDTNSYGMFICLDQKRSRVFGYNEDGRLLYIIGGPGQREGQFRNPVDADFVGDDIMVLDALSQSIDLYSPTAYGRAIHDAVRHQYTFDYDQASTFWREALAYNHNFTLAYSGIGRSLLRAGQYDEAMEYLKMGEDREYYSKAFEKVRNRDLKEWFVPGMIALIALIILSKTVKYIRKRRKEKEGVA